MILNEKAKEAARRIKADLMKELKCSESSINKYIRKNESNGQLTTAGAMKLLREESGLKDSELLVSETTTQKSTAAQA